MSATQPANELSPSVLETYHTLTERQKTEVADLDDKFKKATDDLNVKFKQAKETLSRIHIQEQHDLWTKLHSAPQSTMATEHPEASNPQPSFSINQPDPSAPRNQGPARTVPFPSLSATTVQIQQKPAPKPQGKLASEKREAGEFHVLSSSSEDDIPLAQLRRKGLKPSSQREYDPPKLKAPMLVFVRSSGVSNIDAIKESAQQGHRIPGLDSTNAFGSKISLPTHGLPLNPVSFQSSRIDAASRLRMAVSIPSQNEQANSDETREHNNVPLPVSQQERRMDKAIRYSSYQPVNKASSKCSALSQFKAPLPPTNPAIPIRKRTIQHNVSDSDGADSEFQLSSGDDMPLIIRRQNHAAKKLKVGSFSFVSKEAVEHTKKNAVGVDAADYITSSPPPHEASRPNNLSQCLRISTTVSPSVDADPGRNKPLLETTTPIGGSMFPSRTQRRTGRAAKQKALQKLEDHFQKAADFYEEESVCQAEELERLPRGRISGTGELDIGNHVRGMSITHGLSDIADDRTELSGYQRWTRDRMNGDRYLSKSVAGTHLGCQDASYSPSSSPDVSTFSAHRWRDGES